ncbi:MAG: DUF4349 domain-containing protein [Gemmatimonadaceae bacterium]|nr:DUF4349 domain-containing protein [Gemmatimonadaceae bacterium]
MRPLRSLALLLLAAACSDRPAGVSAEQHAMMDYAAAAASEPAPPAPQSLAAPKAAVGLGRQAGGGTGPSLPAALPGAGGVQQSAMIIRTGTASVEVRALDSAMVSVRQLATSLGGYVANTSTHGGRDQVRAATLELKLPAARFESAISGLEPVGAVESVNVEAQDVGEELVDLEARIANARRLEARLIELLATRTGKLEDVLAVERELARVREEIERGEGRLRYLRTRVAVSTLVVSLHEPHPILGRTDNPMAEAWRDAWRNFVALVAYSIAALGIVLPVALVLAGIVMFVRRAALRRAAVNRNGAPGVAC